MESVRENLQVLARRLGLLQASCCETCCGEDVSPTQSHILFEIRRMGKPSMQRVAEELGIEVTTFSRQAKTLTGNGLIARRVSPDDRRVNLLELTDEGVKVLERIDLHLNDRLDRVFSHMTPFERDVVTRSIDMLASAVHGAGDGDAESVENTKTG